MHRRISPILIAAALLSGGFPTRRKEDEEPAKDPQSPPERDDLPASPGTRTVSEIYERRYGRDLFTPKFLNLGNLRAVLHQRVDTYLRRLEEDDDAKRFRIAAERFGYTLFVSVRHTNKRSPIRSLDCFGLREEELGD